MVGRYIIPDPIESSTQFLQYHHLDLAELTLDELEREARRVQHVLDFTDRPDPWLTERLDAIRQDLDARQRNPAAPPEQHVDHPYQRRQAARVARFKSQLYADPYFGTPERRAKGIPVAILKPRETSHEQR